MCSTPHLIARPEPEWRQCEWNTRKVHKAPLGTFAAMRAAADSKSESTTVLAGHVQNRIEAQQGDRGDLLTTELIISAGRDHSDNGADCGSAGRLVSSFAGMDRHHLNV